MKKWRTLEERKKALELYYNEGKTKKEIAEIMKLSVNTVKSWIHRSKYKKFKQESTDNQINDEVELIERNRETKNRSKTERLRAVKIEIVNKHKGNIDKDVKEEIKNLQMQVAMLRDFLCRVERR
jgi:DNA-directed RNA polymerase specialized sigma subunit, sigma24 homolog